MTVFRFILRVLFASCPIAPQRDRYAEWLSAAYPAELTTSEVEAMHAARWD
jgi:hypothetical protein